MPVARDRHSIQNPRVLVTERVVGNPSPTGLWKRCPSYERSSVFSMDWPAGRNVLHSLVRAEEGTSTTHTIPLVTLVRIFTSVYNATSFTLALNRGRNPSEGNPGAAKAAPRTPLFLRSRH